MDKTSMWITFGEMTVMLILLCVLLWQVCKRDFHSFLVFFIILMIIIDVNTILLSLSFYLEETDYHETHTSLLAIVIGVTTVI